MALKSTICKAELQIADMDRAYYADHALTIARHPSETDERMMLRIVAFALHAHERLEFSKGLSNPEEPDLWQKDLTGQIEHWIELGQPDDKDVLRACGRSGQVHLYPYGNAAGPWWAAMQPKLERARNVQVRQIKSVGDEPLAVLAQRNMQLQVTIQEGQVWLSDALRTAQAEIVTLREAAE